MDIDFHGIGFQGQRIDWSAGQLGRGMSAAELARRLEVGVPTATRMELSEAEDRITLSTLRRAAEALGCELHYALVPRQPLADTLEKRAQTLARQQMAAVSHTMALEAQSTSKETVEAQTRALAESLLKGSRRALWKSPGRKTE